MCELVIESKSAMGLDILFYEEQEKLSRFLFNLETIVAEKILHKKEKVGDFFLQKHISPELNFINDFIITDALYKVLRYLKRHKQFFQIDYCYNMITELLEQDSLEVDFVSEIIIEIAKRCVKDINSEIEETSYFGSKKFCFSILRGILYLFQDKILDIDSKRFEGELENSLSIIKAHQKKHVEVILN